MAPVKPVAREAESREERRQPSEQTDAIAMEEEEARVRIEALGESAAAKGEEGETVVEREGGPP